MRRYAGIGLQAGRQGRGVADLAAVVGDRPVIGAVRSAAQLDRLAEALQGRAQAEAEQLQRHRGAQRRDRLSGVGDHDEALGRGGDDLLAQLGAAAALDQPAVGGDLVCSIDRDVKSLQLAELLDPEAQLPGLALGRRRGRDAADLAQTAPRQRRQQVGDRRAGAEADRHAVEDQLRRRLGGEPLLALGIALSRHVHGNLCAWQ